MRNLFANIAGVIDARRDSIYSVLNWIVLVLSLALVIYLSVNILSSVDFMHDRAYMLFQLWVCIVFLSVFFIELILSRHKWRYLWRRWLFFFLSVPYAYIIDALGIRLSADMLYVVHFIPLARGVLSGAMVVGYVSANRITGIFFSYLVVLLAFVYFGSLIFWAREQGINPEVPDYGAAVWWACSEVTTVGCTIFPVTVAGQIIAAVLAIMGMIMFPLFTVYITDQARSMMQKSLAAKNRAAAVLTAKTEKEPGRKASANRPGT